MVFEVMGIKVVYLVMGNKIDVVRLVEEVERRLGMGVIIKYDLFVKYLREDLLMLEVLIWD